MLKRLYEFFLKPSAYKNQSSLTKLKLKFFPDLDRTYTAQIFDGFSFQIIYFLKMYYPKNK
ncbi:hypothetical protein SAMN05444372_101436 [Flavobacterium micromati]|uniref:Uncharacterized protein n=1 Tax=Flavobacterium micromati TaxID=229205 RepID=A0A1M5G3V3_9FLAO|nr:hypothetical protein SAMN05444372_101436 [Flavobacterium micromati]